LWYGAKGRGAKHPIPGQLKYTDQTRDGDEGSITFIRPISPEPSPREQKGER